MRRLEFAITKACCLCGTHLVVKLQCVAAISQLRQDFFTDFSLNAHLVWRPLVMEMRLSEGLLDRQPEINRVNDG